MEWFNYLLKVSACSAFFFAFYLLVLRRLTFFKINRFYLLFTLLLSFVIPTLQFTIEREIEAAPIIEAPIMFQNENAIEQIAIAPTTTILSSLPIEEPFNWFTLLPYLYATVVVILLGLAAWRLFKLLKHTKQNTKEINGLKLVPKSDGFTNCSFFSYVFIDENSLTESELQVLLRHEEVHVKQYHSVDKIMLIIVKAVLWFNPIVYFYDKALEQIHEYEADELTSQNFGTAIYANLLLRLAVTKSDMPLVHNFVKSPIKVRIKMLYHSKSKNMKKLMYLLALPIGLGLLWGFTVDVIDVIPKTEKEFTLILDAGHGGKQIGAQVNGVKEKDIALVFANKVKALAEAKGIKVITTRTSDKDVSLNDRVKANGDILLSLHVNSEPITNGGERNGIEMFNFHINENLKSEKAISLSENLFKAIQNVNGINVNPKLQSKNLLLLRESKVPALILELGYLTNKSDLKFITNEAKQNELAAAIVDGIMLYKDKAGTDEKIGLNGIKNGSLLKVIQQDVPFINRQTVSSNTGKKHENIKVTVKNKTVANITTSVVGVAKLYFLIDEKLYSEAEAKKFTPAFIAQLSANNGVGSLKTAYDIAEVEKSINNFVIWFGKEPKLADYALKNKSYYEKYNGKTIEGKVIGFTYSAAKVMDGFLVKTSAGETLKANVEAKFAKQTATMIAKDDNVAIKIYNAHYQVDSDYPVLTSYKISKGGKLLYDRWPKVASNKTTVNNKAANVEQNQQFNNLTKPTLISSTNVRVDTKNEISYIKMGRMEIYGGVLLADELTFDQKNKRVITQKANFTDKAGKVIIGDAITFDYGKGTYDVKAASGNSYPVNKKAGLINLDPIKYTATDSIITNKLTGDVLLYGNVKLLNNNQTYQSDRMVYNKGKQTLKVRDNLQMYDKMSNTYTKADSLDMNLKTGKGIFYGKTLLKFDR